MPSGFPVFSELRKQTPARRREGGRGVEGKPEGWRAAGRVIGSHQVKIGGCLQIVLWCSLTMHESLCS